MKSRIHGHDPHTGKAYLRTWGPSRSGFSLIALLVVMGILAVLISILLPPMSAARQTGQSAACLANMHRLGVSTVMYLDKSEGQFFPFRL